MNFLIQMATLKSPFYGEKDNITSLVEKIRRAQFPPVQDDCYTDQLEMLIQTCLALDPEKRPTSGEVSRVSRVMNERWQAYNDTNVYTISADGLVPTASSSEPSSSSFTGCVESVDKLKAEETKRWGSH
jgi:serine/threonine protein kinase